jgi:hypothetical protein
MSSSPVLHSASAHTSSKSAAACSSTPEPIATHLHTLVANFIYKQGHLREKQVSFCPNSDAEMALLSNLERSGLLLGSSPFEADFQVGTV